LFVLNTSVYGQELTEKGVRLSFGGYLKQLNGLYSLPESEQYLQDQLWHSRINLDLALGKYWSIETGIRSRLFYGDLVKVTPDFGDIIDDAGSDWLDLSVNWIDRDQWVLNTTLDRFFFQYSKKKWDVRVGRQRINWGVTNFWNPNDIFNQYLFIDFDYEERPGRDAVRATYYRGVGSSLEIAFTASDHIRDWNAALLYKWNKWNYDFQILGGVHEANTVAGGAWAGAIGQVGFKGEGSVFISWDDPVEVEGVLSVEADYAFVNGWYVAGGGLYQSTGSVSGSLALLGGFQPTAKMLYPFRWTVFGMARYPVSPLINTGLAILYSPVESQAVFINPSFTYSVARDWDIDLVIQTIFTEKENKYSSDLFAGFLRIKWSY
jgi:hypothetical protein